MGRADDGVATVSLYGDRQITYAEYGHSEGDPVVFLHGTPGSRRLAALFAEGAREQGIRLIAPDRPGYGRSSPWPGRSVRDAGQFVTAVVDDAGVESADLVAFSGGAPYALAAAATRSDRFSRVDVVAGATPPGVSEETPATQRLLAGLATRTPRLLGGLFRAQAWLAARRDPSFVVSQYTTGDAESVSDEIAAILRADFVEAFARHRSGAVTEFRQTDTDWGVDFDAVDARVHIWHGTADTNVPIGDARRLAARIQNAELHVLDGADHLRTLLRSVPDIMERER